MLKFQCLKIYLQRRLQHGYGQQKETWRTFRKHLARLDATGNKPTQNWGFHWTLNRPAARVSEVATVWRRINSIIIMPRPPPLGGGIKRWCCLTSVCLWRTLGLSREQRPRKTKIGTVVGHVTRDSWTPFSRSKGQGERGKGYIVAAYCTACYYWKEVTPLLLHESRWRRKKPSVFLLAGTRNGFWPLKLQTKTHC